MTEAQERSCGGDGVRSRSRCDDRDLRRAVTVAGVAVAVVLLLAACSAPAGGGAPTFTPIASTFDTDTEGWTSSEPLDPAWEAPGYLSLVDAGPDWYYAIAPSVFHGDWTGASSISFDVLADAAGVSFPIRVVVSGAGTTMYHEFPLAALEAGAWRSLAVPLQAGHWRVFAGEQSEGEVVAAGAFAAALASVEDVRIRVDVNDKFSGDEFNGIDDVVVD